MSASKPQSVPFSVSLARELTTFEGQVGLEKALKWRLNEACDEIERIEEQFEVADAFARVADAYCWDSETTTHDDLMNARAAWQTAVGQMKLRAASSPASRQDSA